jgi:cell wall-associated NlpC family hydrolase
MYSKIAAGIAASVLVLAVLVGYSAKAVVESLFGGSSTANCAAQIADIPPDYCVLYLAAAPSCPGLDWSVLAAIGKVETDHGRSTLPGVHHGENFAGAGGPMQFLSSTFNNVVAAHRIPPGGADPPSRYNPHDAIHAAAFLLCDEGVRRGDLRAAIFAYNHANWYVDMVLDQAAKYAEAAASTGIGDCDNVVALNAVVLKAINYACKHLGWPYVWGGNGPDYNHPGFDCSGLTMTSYEAAGVKLLRTAQQQFDMGPRVPAGQPLMPGDLVFYGTPQNIHHVGLYLGKGKMINAPTFGIPVRIDNYRHGGDDYAGATRPWGFL